MALTEGAIASHNHPMIATTDTATSLMPGSNLPGKPGGLLGTKIYADGLPNTTMNAAAISSNAGGNQSHNNIQPYLGLNYIIALQGIFPSRN